MVDVLEVGSEIILVKDFVGDLIGIGIGKRRILFEVDKVVTNGGIGIRLRLKPILIWGENSGGHGVESLFPEPDEGGSND